MQSEICILQLLSDNCVLQPILIQTVFPVGSHSLKKSRLVPKANKLLEDFNSQSNYGI